jgi:hypothetical protein
VATAAHQELTELLQRQGRLKARADEIAAEERAALAAVKVASDALIALERTAASGTKVSAAKRTEAEDALLQVRSTAAAPWAERRQAAGLAAADARQAVAVYVGQHLDPLLAELETEGRQAAEEVDAAARQLLGAYAERAAVEQRTFSLLSLIGRVQPGDVRRTQAEPVAAAAEALLQRGGERWPEVLRRPNEPRHTVVTDVAEVVSA